MPVKRPHAFKLTDTEQALLELVEENPQMSHRAIAKALGRQALRVTIDLAVQKHRDYRLWQEQQRQQGGQTTLAKARVSTNGKYGR